MIKFGDMALGRTAVVALAAAFAMAAGVAAAQPQKSAGQHRQAAAAQPSGPPNALQGFSQNRDKPVKINADELEVHDKDKMAVFSGDVHLVQGDTEMRSSSLVVYYDDQPPPPSKAGKGAAQASAQITPQQNQQIKRVEAKGHVLVEKKQKDQKSQTATGDEGIFDMRANTVTMVGKPVVISQGDSVLTGDNLIVNMTTGDAILTSGKDKGGGRVKGLFNPSTMKQGSEGGGGLFPMPGRKP